MSRLAALALARPKRVLGVTLSIVGVFGLLGLGVENRLHRSSIEIAGTKSSKALASERSHFGEGYPLAVLVQGPPRAAELQARELARRFERQPELRVLGPWSPGARAALSPRPGKILLNVQAQGSFEHDSRVVVPRMRAELRRSIHAPVQAHLTGAPDIASGLHSGVVKGLERAELIAAPLLMLILLLVFRSPIAAGLPLMVGLMTITTSRGVLSLMNDALGLDVVSLNLASMMGLALGVDYSLLLVSRFREQLAAGQSTEVAARVTMQRAGRTVVFAGLAIMVAIGAVVAVMPGRILVSSSTGVVVAAALSVLGASTLLPATLVLLGPRIDRWHFGRAAGAASSWGRLALRAVRRPAIAAGLVAALLVALSAPALALETGPPTPLGLPRDSIVRQDFDAIRHSLGGGWAVPYEVIVTTKHGAITDPARLAALARWQRQLARNRHVRAVFGPGDLASRTRALREVPRQLRTGRSQLRSGTRQLERLRGGLGRASAGADELRAGLAAAGAGALSLRDGASRLNGGLDRSASGTDELTAGMRRARRGAAALQAGLARARAGVANAVSGSALLAGSLRSGAGDLERLRQPAQIAGSNLASALAALNAMGATSKLDPQYRRAYQAVATASGAVTGRNPLTGRSVQAGYDGLDASLAAGAGRLRTASGAVSRAVAQTRALLGGLVVLQRGARSLDRGLARLGAGVRSLSGGIAQLQTGGRSLAAGAGRLRAGSAGGAAGTAALVSGLGRLRSGADTFASRTARLQRALPSGTAGTAMFSSGYAALAAIDRSRRAARNASTFILNLDRGGSAARVIVVQRSGDPTRKGTPLRGELERAAAQLGRTSDMNAQVAGAAAELQDFDSSSSGRLPLVALVLMGVTYLVLIPILRSVLLPLLAVLLNLATVTAAFGVLSLAFEGSAPLGGPGFLDAIMVTGIFATVFGLSIDYEVFLLTRMREGHALHGSTDEALAYGLRTTAGVITGAALIMTGVFVAFALADLASMRQLGVGLTVAVILDATVVRLVLLPAAIRLVGRAAWWLPGWLDRRLPTFDFDGRAIPPPVEPPVVAPERVLVAG